jgi:2-methylisocitrate lyase-like PEP mutase family enzyme
MPQSQKNRRLRELLAGEKIVRSFAPHDVFAALILQNAGIELVFLGGFGVSASLLGLPDVGLTTMSEMADAVRRMCDRLTVPLIADGDTGYGNFQNVIRTVRSFEQAGASGILLEDQVSPKRCGHFAGKDVIPKSAMLDKLKVVLDARSDDDFVIVARTDALAVEGIDAAIDRANAYADLGADVCFVEAPKSTAELERVASEISRPQLANMLPGGVTPIHSADELEAMGFRIVVDPIGTLLASGQIMERLARAMIEDGRTDIMQTDMMSFEEIKSLLGFSPK